MTSRNTAIVVVVVSSAFAIAYLLGRNEALNDSLNFISSSCFLFIKVAPSEMEKTR